MLLGFKEEHNGIETGFVRKILGGMPKNLHMIRGRDFNDFQTDYWRGVNVHSHQPKIHTIRDDPNGRWQPGRWIHFATGVRTPHLKMFAIGECLSTQDIVFRIYDKPTLLVAVGHKGTKDWSVLDDEEKLKLAINDGFDTWEAFDDWFRPLVVAEGNRLDRKLIHWTNFKY